MNMPGEDQSSPSEAQTRNQLEAMSLYENYEVRRIFPLPNRLKPRTNDSEILGLAEKGPVL